MRRSLLLIATCAFSAGAFTPVRAQSELPVTHPPSGHGSHAASPPGTMKIPPIYSRPTVRRVDDPEDVRLARTGRARVLREIEMVEIDAVETRDTILLREDGKRVDKWLDDLAQDPWPWHRDTLVGIEWATLAQIGHGWATTCKNAEVTTPRLIAAFELWRRAVAEHCAKAGSPWPRLDEVTLAAVRVSEGVGVRRAHPSMARDLEDVRTLASLLDAESPPTWHPIASDVVAWSLRARRICEVADFLAYDAPYPAVTRLSRSSTELSHLCVALMDEVSAAYPRAGDAMPSSK